MSENVQPQPGEDELGNDSEESSSDGAERTEADRLRHVHEDEMVDEWEDESFPASDPPGYY